MENNSCSKSKITAGILAILLGGFGVHKFYLGKASGIIYLLFCWTLIPWLVAIIEGIIYLSSSDEEFAKRYVKKVAVKYTEAGTTIRQEINTLRVQISGLNQRVNNLEGNLVKKDIAEPKPEPVVMTVVTLSA